MRARRIITLEIIPLPHEKTIVGYPSVFTVKIGPTSQVDRLKARLVFEGYTRIYGVDYGDTFLRWARLH